MFIELVLLCHCCSIDKVRYQCCLQPSIIVPQGMVYVVYFACCLCLLVCCQSAGINDDDDDDDHRKQP